MIAAIIETIAIVFCIILVIIACLIGGIVSIIAFAGPASLIKLALLLTAVVFVIKRTKSRF